MEGLLPRTPLGTVKINVQGATKRTGISPQEWTASAGRAVAARMVGTQRSVEELHQHHHQEQLEPRAKRHGGLTLLGHEPELVHQALLHQSLLEAVLLRDADVVAVVNMAHVLDEVEAVLLGVGGVAGLDEAVVVVPVVGGIVGLDGTVEVVAGERDDGDVLIVIYWKRLRRGGMREASPGTTDSPPGVEGRTAGSVGTCHTAI